LDWTQGLYLEIWYCFQDVVGRELGSGGDDDDDELSGGGSAGKYRCFSCF